MQAPPDQRRRGQKGRREFDYILKSGGRGHFLAGCAAGYGDPVAVFVYGDGAGAFVAVLVSGLRRPEFRHTRMQSDAAKLAVAAMDDAFLDTRKLGKRFAQAGGLCNDRCLAPEGGRSGLRCHLCCMAICGFVGMSATQRHMSLDDEFGVACFHAVLHAVRQVGGHYRFGRRSPFRQISKHVGRSADRKDARFSIVRWHPTSCSLGLTAAGSLDGGFHA